MRQSGRSMSLQLQAKGVTSRTACQNAREAVASIIAGSPNGFIKPWSAPGRGAPEGEKPSSRSAVTPPPAPATAGTDAATSDGRCAAPETSQAEPMALV